MPLLQWLRYILVAASLSASLLTCPYVERTDVIAYNAVIDMLWLSLTVNYEHFFTQVLSWHWLESF